MATLTENGEIVDEPPRGRASDLPPGLHPAGPPPLHGGFARPSFTLRDALTIVFFDRWAILTAFLVPVILGLALSLFTRTTYQADARLLVLLGREYVFRPDIGEQLPGFSFDRDQIVKAELEILGSRELKVEVVRSIGMDEMYPRLRVGTTPETVPPDQANRRPRALDVAVDQFDQNLRLTPVQGSNVIQLAFVHPDPQIAAEALNLLIRFYMEKRRDVFSQTRSAVIQEQRDQYAQRLHEVEDRIQKFRKDNNISNVEEQINLLLRQENDQVSAELQLEQNARGLQAQLDGLKAQIAATPAQILLATDSARTPALDSARATLMGLELRRRDLLTKYREGSRVIADVDAQIQQARSFLAQDDHRVSDSTRYGRNPVLDDLERDRARLDAELKGTRARRTEIDGNVQKIRDQLAALAGQDQAFRALERDHAILDDSYRTYTKRLEEAKITEEFDKSKTANVRIIAPAEPPSEGRSLRLPIIAASMFLGILAALTTAFVMAQMRQTYLTPEDAERSLSLPVLLTVPLREAAEVPRARRQLWPGWGRRA